MRLTLIIQNLGPGGAERVMAVLANAWAARGWAITLLTLDNGTEPPFYELDARIDHRPLKTYWPSPNRIAAAWNMLRRIRALRQAIRASRPEVIISFCKSTNVMTLLATYGLHIPVIVEEQIDPSMNPPDNPWVILRRWVYPQAKYVIVLSDQYQSYFPAAIQQICRTIPNPISEIPRTDTARVSKDTDKKMIIAMGRLDWQKGFDLLLQGFECIADRYPDWSLTIWGEGPERDALERLRSDLRLDERIYLPGITKQPFEKMHQADLFVLSSRFEGFPMVLCEAMACGLPVISFDCCAGVRDIIRNDVDGMLVPPEDVHALANAMGKLIAQPQERQRLASRGPEILDRFGQERILHIWDQTIAEVLR